MFKKANLEGEKFTDIEKASKFIDKGIVAVTPSTNGEQEILLKLRNLIELEFESQSYPRNIQLNKIFEKEIVSQITKLLSNEYIQKFFRSLENECKYGEVTLFPFLNIMRNYFSGPQNGQHGWHDDCGGERKYEYCRRKLSDKCLFGKILIPLQQNGEMGGCIDFAEGTFSESPTVSICQRVSNKLQNIYLNINNKSHALPPLLGDQWLTDLIALPTFPKSVASNPLQVIAFSHKLFHRGTPISPRGWKEILKKHSDAKIKDYHLSGNINLRHFNKYMIYACFGNKIGLESYIYDRSRRVGWEEEKRTWVEQYKTLEIFKKVYKNSSILFEQGCLESENKKLVQKTLLN